MSRSRPLPDGLPPVFTVAQAKALGVGPDRLRTAHRPTRAVRSPHPARSLEQRIEAFDPVLPEWCALSHLTAARVHGLWLPDEWRPDEPLHVVHDAGHTGPRRVGVRAHAVRTPRRLTRLPGGRAVTTAAEAWADLAACLTLDDLVVAGDSVLRFRGELGSLDELDAACRRVRSGAKRLLAARELVRPGSASAMETRLRLLLGRADLPEPELNGAVHDASGAYVGAFDLLWRAERVIGEYDGDQHRTDRDQWQRDHRRLRAVRELGWEVVTVTADDVLRTPSATVDLFRRAIERGRRAAPPEAGSQV